MTYFMAETMRQECLVALRYREMFPEKLEAVARKYAADQWVECAEAILVHLEEEKARLFTLIGLIELIRKGDADATQANDGGGPSNEQEDANADRDD